MLVAQHDRAPEAVGDGAGAPTQVEELAARRVHHHSADGAVAQQAFGGDARDGAEALDLALQRVELGQRVDRRARRRASTTSAPAIGRDSGSVAAAGTLAEQHQRVGASLRSVRVSAAPSGGCSSSRTAPDDADASGSRKPLTALPPVVGESVKPRRSNAKPASRRASSSSASDAHCRVTRGKSCTSTVAAASSSTVSYSS